ncbi:MAG: PTS sugar transporter subunit IIA [Thermodesulfobacteriota bacterium]|nr:PTS sugar transporter subunit IIA [Thermodesulfobacteriota bacterium]MEE2975168.1 PTS sugar transporter subunit IIA [Thermodesulfobacteriota bacterium]|tara:strand:- start:548 stop:943 length:396 start_codon:yes stop_codon:yes gene_type:complete
MFGILIITHGKLSEELKSSVEFVLGEKIVREIFTLNIDEDSRDYETYSNKIANYLMENSNTIIFTDMFGGTPSNIGLAYFKKDSVEIISGVNLPMLIKAATIENCETFKEAVNIIRESGKENIIVAGDLEI